MSEAPPDDLLWNAVADPTRRALLDVLLAGAAATPTALAEQLPVTRQAVSKHLAVLERAGLVGRERLGREVRLVVRAERVDEAARALAGKAAAWSRRLDRIRTLAEAAHRDAASPQGGT